MEWNGHGMEWNGMEQIVNRAEVIWGRVTSGCERSTSRPRIADDQLIVRDLKRIGRLQCW